MDLLNVKQYCPQNNQAPFYEYDSCHVVFCVLVNLVSQTAGRTSEGVREYCAEENIWTKVREAVNRRRCKVV
jgi:hypothetical protein